MSGAERRYRLQVELGRVRREMRQEMDKVIANAANTAWSVGGLLGCWLYTHSLWSAAVFVLVARYGLAALNHLAQWVEWLGELRLLRIEYEAGDFSSWAEDYVQGIDRVVAGRRWRCRNAVLAEVPERRLVESGDFLRRSALFRTAEGGWFELFGIVLEGRWNYDGFHALQEADVRTRWSADLDRYRHFFGEPPLAGAA